MFFSTITIASTFISMAISSPVQIEARDDWAKVVSFSGDLCTGEQDTIELVGGGAYRCVPVTNRRSIKAIEKRYPFSLITEKKWNL